MLPFSSHQVAGIEDHPFRLDYPNDVLVRTGVDADGNCFFHSYLYSVEAISFKDLSYGERLNRVMQIKNLFASMITVDDILDLIDVTNFETMLELVEKHLKGYELPDLSKQPLLSFRNYLLLVYESHPGLNQNESFQYMIHLMQQEYLSNVHEYIKRDGSWMQDSYIVLFMQKFRINIIMYSFDTNRRITHLPAYRMPDANQSTPTILLLHILNHFESIGSYDRESQHMTRLFT